MKPREPRRTCLIKARIRLDGVWKDACIRNISSRGMLVQADSPPGRGTYIDIYSGKHVVVGRVAWSSGRRFGLQSQDRLNIDALLGQPDLSAIDYRKAAQTNPAFERRSVPRQDAAALHWRSERNRHLATAFQFACIVVAGATLCLSLAAAASETLARPLAAVSVALAK